MTDINAIIAENERRKALACAPYDPLTGEGCLGPRRRALFLGSEAWVPEDMPDTAGMSAAEAIDTRFRHDFEYWAARCATIRDKLSGADVRLRLNAGQRKVLDALEKQRRAGRPMRIIILKARQWGSSTFVQVYMAWIQIVHRRNWNSLICAHVKDTAITIRRIYTRLLEGYPDGLWREEKEAAFSAVAGSQNSRQIAGRGATVTVGSSENPDSCRGSDIAMAHLSEVAFWKDSRQHAPEELVQAAVSGVARIADSLIVMESTANGVGSYFHREWLRSEAGKSDKTPVFVAWHEIEIYREQVADPACLWAAMDDYERGLWEAGVTLEAIAWYHGKRREMSTDTRMKAEFPSTPAEAFAFSGTGVFTSADVGRLRLGCREGRVSDGLEVWAVPENGAEYVVTVDVGGRCDTADWSIIAVMRRGERPEVVAQWRGHSDHDLLARRAEEIARRYNEALLVVESNTLESASPAGEPSVVLNRLVLSYPNVYMRAISDEWGRPTAMRRAGFHTNVKTKASAITRLIAAVRDGAYTERSHEACNELLTYEQLPNGGWAARRGCHDDIVMTRAIALEVMAATTEAPAAPALRLPYW